jgi:hypothetical protein
VWYFHSCAPESVKSSRGFLFSVSKSCHPEPGEGLLGLYSHVHLSTSVPAIRCKLPFAFLKARPRAGFPLLSGSPSSKNKYLAIHHNATSLRGGGTTTKQSYNTFANRINLHNNKLKHGGCVYLITNQYNKVLYTGVTSKLRARIWEH